MNKDQLKTLIKEHGVNFSLKFLQFLDHVDSLNKRQLNVDLDKLSYIQLYSVLDREEIEFDLPYLNHYNVYNVLNREGFYEFKDYEINLIEEFFKLFVNKYPGDKELHSVFVEIFMDPICFSIEYGEIYLRSETM